MGKEGLPGGGVNALEQKYISLLESRIADLECQLRGGRGAVETPKHDEAEDQGDVDTDEEKEEEKSSSNKRTGDAGKITDDNLVNKKADGNKSGSRYKIVLSQYDSETGERVDKEKTLMKPKSEPTKGKADRAFTFRKFLKLARDAALGNQVFKLTGSEVEIESEALRLLLGRITARYEVSEKITRMSSPYRDLIYCWDEAEALAETTVPNESESDAEAREDLKELLLLISTSSGDEIVDQYFKDRKSMRDAQQITFDALWTLFPRGTEIVGRPFENQEQMFFVNDCISPFDSRSGSNDDACKIICYGYDWDGATWGRVPYQVSIERFQDKRNISELPYYPLQYHQDRQEVGRDNHAAIERLKKRLRERGKKFQNYSTRPQGKQMLRYNATGYYQRGAGLFRTSTIPGTEEDARSLFSDSQGNAHTDSGLSKLNVKGTVVVDFKSFYQYQSSKLTPLGDMTRYVGFLECDCVDCKANYEGLARFSWDRNKDTPTDDQLLFLPPRVLGYALEQKRWVQLHVTELREPQQADQTNFENKLQLAKDYKDLIRRAVQAHSTSKSQNIVDFMPDKGKGLVILLWGLPGVGKTLTAESVALLAGKPLFSVGVSDLGLEGSKVEMNLQKVFDLAGLWEAVLLFDEADVFLEARDTHRSDMQRNTIVSVLLRALEYYNGILILTTNRLKSFDIAVQSRIHIAIEYKDLTEQQRYDIFIEFLKQLQNRNLIGNWNDIQGWVNESGKEKDFNGRQIRNIVSTAMAIANADKSKLQRKHLNDVCKHVSEFKKVLQAQETLFRNNQIDPGK